MASAVPPQACRRAAISEAAPGERTEQRMPDRPHGIRAASAGESPGLALWLVTNRWQAVMRAALAPHGLTHVQYVLLATLVHLEHRQPDAVITQTVLADAAATDPMMTSQVVRALEAKSLLERPPAPHDRRARMLRATDAGVAVAAAATSSVEDADERFFAGLDDPGRFTADLTALSAGAAGGSASVLT